LGGIPNSRNALFFANLFETCCEAKLETPQLGCRENQSLPNILQKFRNLLRTLLDPDPAPAPVHIGAILGGRPMLLVIKKEKRDGDWGMAEEGQQHPDRIS
jgi:hypothetical protein